MKHLQLGFLGLVIILAGILVSCGLQKAADVTISRDSKDLKRYSGTEIRFITNKHPWVDVIRSRIDEFTEATGISVVITEYPEEQFRTKRTVELLSGLPRFDVFMIMPGNSLDAYLKAGWIEALNPYMENPSMAWPAYDMDDIFPTALEVGVRSGVNYTLPIMLETSLLAYNKELLENYGVDPPRTMEQLQDAARRIWTDSGGEIFGITMRGKRSAATSQWIDFARSFGGDWLDTEGKAALHSPAAVESLRFYASLLNRYGPKSAPSNGWYESTSLFMQGRAAMIYDASVFKSNYENPQMSEVAGKVGYLPIPEGPAGAVPHASSWGLAIFPGSEKKNASWFFMQWATSSEYALEGLLAGIPAARKSVWEHPRFLEGELSTEWTKSSLDSYSKASSLWNPPVIAVERGRNIAGNPIVTAILGGDVQAAADDASRQLDELIRKEKSDSQ
jgi:multiple sugar transport system substrate-binding protein